MCCILFSSFSKKRRRSDTARNYGLARTLNGLSQKKILLNGLPVVYGKYRGPGPPDFCPLNF